MKKILAGLLLSLVVLGCGKDDTKVLKVATYQGGGSDFLEEVVKAYGEENPDLKVELEIIDNTQYDNTMKIRNTANQLPDVFPTRVTTMMDYKNVLIPLDELRAAKNNPYAHLFKMDGQEYGVPMYAFREYVYYRKSAFEELGLSVPQTWNEFLEVIKIIKTDGSYIPLALGAKDSWTVYPYNEFMPFVEKGGENVLEKMAEDETPFSSGKPFYESYKKINTLYQLEPSGNDPLGYGWTQSKDMFMGKRAVMIAAGQWFYEEGLESMDTDVKEDIGAFLLPVRDSKEDPFRALLMAELFLSIPKSSKNQEEAKNFINYVFDNAERFEGYGTLISPEGVVSDHQLFNDALSAAGDIEDVLNHGGSEKYNKIASKLQFDVKAMGQEMLMGRDFEEYMASYNNRWQRAVSELN